MHLVLFAAFTSFLHFNYQLHIIKSNVTSRRYIYNSQDIEKLNFNYNETAEWCGLTKGKLLLLTNDTILREELSHFPDVKVFLDVTPMDASKNDAIKSFKWSNGEQFEGTEWADNEPNCNATCCVIYFHNDKYYDASCSEGGSLFCDISSAPADFDIVEHTSNIMNHQMGKNKLASGKANMDAAIQLSKTLKERRREVGYTRKRIMATRTLKIVMILLCATMLASMALTVISRKIPVNSIIIDAAQTQGQEMSVKPTASDAPQSRITDASQSRTTDVSQLRTTDVGQSRTSDASQSRTSDVSQSRTTDVGQSKTTDVSQLRTTDVSQSRTTDVGQSRTSDASQSKTTDASQSKTTDVPV